MAEIHAEGNILDMVAPTDVAPGLIVQHPSGVNGIVLGDGGATGETVAVQVKYLVRVANPDSVSLAAGATAGYDQAGDKLAIGGGGTFDIGEVVYGTSGTDDVVCRLNPA